MKYIIALLIVFTCGCSVTREQLEEYDKRVAQAERALDRAEQMLAKAQEHSDHKAIEEARQVAAEARAALAAARESRPEEGDPWWAVAAAVAGAAASGFLGYRRGLKTPVPTGKE